MHPANDDKTAQIWVEYKARPTDQLRNVLLEHYLPLVERSARRLRNRLPACVELGDLVSYGIFGLLEAIDAYQLDRKVRFTTFSARRIRGAMLDELRALDWLPRQLRAFARDVAGARSALHAVLCRPPTDEELAGQLQLSPGRYRELAQHVQAADVRPLERGYRSRRNDEQTMPTLPADDRAVDPAREAQRGMLKELIATGLTRAERLIIILCYYEEMKLREIGVVLGISESRVSQMRTSILARLRARLDIAEDSMDSAMASCAA